MLLRYSAFQCLGRGLGSMNQPRIRYFHIALDTSPVLLCCYSLHFCPNCSMGTLARSRWSMGTFLGRRLLVLHLACRNQPKLLLAMKVVGPSGGEQGGRTAATSDVNSFNLVPFISAKSKVKIEINFNCRCWTTSWKQLVLMHKSHILCTVLKCWNQVLVSLF